MDFLNKAKQTILQSVGIGDQVAEDPQLEALKEKITQLDNIIGVLKKNFHKYSSAVTQLTQSASLVGNDVQQFYTRSKTRQSSIQKFVETQSRVDQVAIEVFRDQFHRDILATFDRWQRQVQGLWANMKLAEELHVSMSKQDAKLRAARENQASGGGASRAAKLKNAASGGGAQFDGPNLADMENEFAFTKARLDTLKAKLETEVNQAVENRYTVFDNILVRLMECQMDFFAGSASALTELKPNVDNYRKRFPKGSIPDALTGEAPIDMADEAKSEEKPQERSKPAASNPSGKVPAKKPARKESVVSEDEEEEEEEEEEEVEEESPQPVRSKPAPKPAPGPSKPAEIDLLGELMGAAPAPKPAPAAQAKPVEGSLFDAFSNGASPAVKPKPAPATASPDEFLQSFGDAPASAPAPAPQKEAAKPKQKAKATKAGKSSGAAAAPAPVAAAGGSKSSAATPKSKPTPTPAPAPVNLALTVSKGTSLAVANSGPMAKTNDAFAGQTEEFVDNGPIDEEKQKPSVTVVIDDNTKAEIAARAEEAVASFQAAKDAEEKLNAQKRDHRLALEEKLNNWEFKGGIRKNIRTLLTTVHTVMWEGSGLDPVPLQTIMSEPGLKKAHRTVVMKCHPDRVKGNPEQEVIAERIFNALNTQYDAHKNGQQQ